MVIKMKKSVARLTKTKLREELEELDYQYQERKREGTSLLIPQILKDNERIFPQYCEDKFDNLDQRSYFLEKQAIIS